MIIGKYPASHAFVPPSLNTSESRLRTIVYDVTVRETFQGLPTWFSELETFSTSPDVVKIIVGNKVDKVRRARKHT